MRTTVENLYRNATYTYSELFSMLSFGIIIGFLFAFNDWGINGVYNRDVGISNLLLSTIVSLFVIFIFTYIQKVIGVFVGVHASHRISWVYLFLSVLICFATSGKVVIFIPPTLHIAQQEHLSIGRKPFAFSIKNLRLFALLPILILISLSVFIGEALNVSDMVSSTLFWISFLTVVYALIPVEFLVNISLLGAKEKAEVVVSAKLTHKVETKGVSLGSILLFGSKMNLLFAIVFLVCSVISQVTDGFFFTILFAFLIALFATTMYFVKTELD